ncbi:thiamine phosphate synthase [Spongiimicrobium salis]|uniref:thiamine phosphate synthase n=1 Tax=Spongiimicrobium salis TaxID=1667022 RepID=UPI00374D13F4
MTIPKLHYISQGDSPEAHLEAIQKACAAGAELVQLRLKHTERQIVLDTAVAARKLTAHFQTRLIINDDYEIAKEVKADGVHLGKTDACPTEARAHMEKWQCIGGTANTLQDCEELIAKEVDYIGLGPYRYTNTKKNLSPILGREGYLTILEILKTETPIIAIGGITLEDVPQLLTTGIHGIAASSEIHEDFNRIGKFNQLLKAPATQEQVWKLEQ